MNELTDQLNNALEQMRHGKPLADFEGEELTSLLAIAETIKTMPRSPVPKAARQRKYIIAKEPTKHFAWFKLFKIGLIPLSLLIFTGGLVRLSSASHPGQTLFSVKKFTEQIPYYLTQDPTKKANIQLRLTQVRLEEAQSILNSSQNSNVKAAAIVELSDQTLNTVSSIQKVAVSNNNKNDSALVSSLEALSQKQQALLTSLPASNNDNSPTDNAKAKLQKVLATVNELSSATLIKPSLLTITGEIEALDKTSITVDKTIIELTDQTIFKQGEKTVSAKELELKLKVSVSARKVEDTIKALEVDIEVSPDVDTKTPAPSTAEPVDTSSDTTSAENTNTAQATFIPEDPAPQFIPGP